MASTPDDGLKKQVGARMTEAIKARDALQEKVDAIKNSGGNAKSLERMIGTYNRDIKGYMRTLGIK